jgi:hypothetical protein
VFNKTAILIVAPAKHYYQKMNRCQENIKYLIPKPETPVIKPPMYRSVYTESVKNAYKSNKGCHRTMGYAEIQLDPPTQFLKKHTRKVLRPCVGKVHIVSQLRI